MKILIGMALNVAVIAGLISGVDVLHSAAFALCIVLQVIAWPCMLILAASKPSELADTILKHWYLKMPFTIAFWLALAYSSHPYLLASSVLFYVFALSVSFNARSTKA